MHTPTRAALVILILAALVAFPGCRRKHSYGQSTPDETLRSAIEMVRNGDADRLATLIYAENDRMRAVLGRLGIFMGNLQELATAIQEKFPQEVAAAKAKAEAALTEPNGSANPFSRVFSVNSGGPPREGQPAGDSGDNSRRRGGGGGFNIRMSAGPGQGPRVSAGPAGGAARSPQGQALDDAAREQAVRDAFSQFFADPYAWIEKNAGRLSTLKIDDETATVTLDNEPVFPPIGIPLKLDGGKWYFALPTHLPPISTYMPRSDPEWSIIGSVIVVLNNIAVELTQDIRAGRIASLSVVAEKAGEKTIAPMALAFGSYVKAMDVRGNRENLWKQYVKRRDAWLADRRQKAGDPGTDTAMPDRLVEALESLAPKAIDKLAPKDKRPKIAEMSDAQFTELLEGWFSADGLAISLAAPLEGPSLDAKFTPWLQRRAEAKSALVKKK